jgi:putative oxidoreductase
MTATRVLARPLLASMFVVGGVNALRNAKALAAKAEPVTDQLRPAIENAVPQASVLPTDPESLVRLNGAAQVVAGLALATGRLPRISSAVLAATLVPTTAAGHRFWEEKDPAARANQQIHFFKNLSMLGGLLLAAVDTEGRPGLVWRARHGARAARREAKHLRREAKLAAKSVG